MTNRGTDMPAGRLRSWLWPAALALILGTALCGCKETSTLGRIREQGRIAVATARTYPYYYYYDQRPQGFQYDLAEGFAEALDVELDILTPRPAQFVEDLVNGRADLLALSTPLPRRQAGQVALSDPLLMCQPAVVVHREDEDIREMTDLNGRQIYVPTGSFFEEVGRDLSLAGVHPAIVAVSGEATADLLRQVSEKAIPCTIADLTTARLYRRYYPDLTVAFVVGNATPVCWAVRKADTQLLAAVNAWLAQVEFTTWLARTHDAYFADVDVENDLGVTEFIRRMRSRLPRFARSIEKMADRYGFDWRLVAAIVYQESHFDPDAESFTGVRGLMQVTTATAEEMGIEDRQDPHQSISAGVGYLKKLYDRWEEIPDPDRLRFALASYNVGLGHVMDAQRIAQGMDLDPTRWSSIEKTLPLLRFRRFYAKSRYGYCRGMEPVEYVQNIMTYYDILRKYASAA